MERSQTENFFMATSDTPKYLFELHPLKRMLILGGNDGRLLVVASNYLYKTTHFLSGFLQILLLTRNCFLFLKSIC